MLSSLNVKVEVMPKYAIILNTTKNTTEFRSSRGFYNKQVKDLQEAGYEILRIDVKSPSCISQLQNLPENSVGFFWPRMHGSAKTMVASETLTIDLDNINEILNFLPRIMHPNGTIFLESCSTGSLEHGCNNIQFAFAKLTLEKPNIQIVAPSKDNNLAYFSVSKDDNFSFEMQESPRTQNNTSLILGQQTKSILSKAVASHTPLESIQDELISSLQMNQTNPFLENFKKNFGTEFDLTDQLINAISAMESSSTTLKQVKEFIEVYHASPNYPEDF